MSKPTKTKYKTTNWSVYNKSLIARGGLMIWIDPQMKWYADHNPNKEGCPTVYSDAAIQLCLTLKVAYGLALRQTMGVVGSLLKLAKLDWSVPDFSTLSRRQARLVVQISRQSRTGKLHSLVDSTGIKVRGEGEWKVKKHGKETRREWLKLHIAIDAETLEIQSVEVTSNGVGDAPMLPALLDQIPADETIASVSADGAYDTKKCHAAMADRGAQAIVPVRKGAGLWPLKTAGAAVRNEAVLATRRLGKRIWKRWSDYHRRSLVETKMRCIKLLGERVMAKCFDRQVAELQIRVAILNRFTQLGTPATVSVG